VEWPPGFLRRESQRLCLSVALTRPLQVHHPQGEGTCRGNDLNRSAIRRGKAGAQHFVATDGLREALLQGAGVEVSCETNRGGDVISGGTGFQLIDQPQPVLRER